MKKSPHSMVYFNISLIFKHTFICFLLLAFTCQFLQAQITWTGVTGTDWDTHTNWNPEQVPTADDDVVIPALPNQPVIGGTTIAALLSLKVDPEATLEIASGGTLNIDGTSTVNWYAFYNQGMVTSNGTINMGLNSPIDQDGLLNQGEFINNGEFYTDEVDIPGRSVINISSQGYYENNGFLEIGPGSEGFSVTILDGTFTNNGTMDSYAQNVSISLNANNAILNNYNIINLASNAGPITVDNGQFINHTCAELYTPWIRIKLGATVDNSGFISFFNSLPGFQEGIWNNTGTIHSLDDELPPGNEVNNIGLIVLANTLTENCGDLSPAFDLGEAPGSTISIYTDEEAMISAGDYDPVSNTFTPNFELDNTTYTLFVKVEDDADICDDYILQWNLTVNPDENEMTYYADNDGDGFGDPNTSQTDCVQPAGYVLDNTDCDDTDETINQGASEICDGIDNNCDGLTDDEDPNVNGQSIWYADTDNDSYGDPDVSQVACSQPTGYVTDNSDCNDGNSAINPGAPEFCDGIDNNCDGLTDGEDPNVNGQSIWFADTDNDSYGDPDVSQMACSQPAGYVADNSDCNDGNSAINPGAPEFCDGIDNNCDGLTDGEDPNVNGQSIWYADTDNDSYGDPDVSQVACSQPTGYVADNSDCNDGNSAINPDAPEFCDGIDNNCDGLTDGEDPNVNGQSIWFADTDNDGYGNPDVSQMACLQPAGYVADNSDCNDGNSAINPGAPEFCDGIDNNCDGLTDGEDPNVNGQSIWFADTDNDSYGDPDVSQMACSQPAGYVADNSDCNDGNSAINPGAPEFCDGIDNNCDGLTDGEDPNVNGQSIWFADTDNDSYGDPDVSQMACLQPAGYVADNSDCNDGNSAINPGAPEFCDGIDNNCDGLTDGEDPNVNGQSIWYADTDNDSYGDPDVSQMACSQPAGYVADNSDCNDGNSAINPGASEICDGIDNNCDGNIDEGFDPDNDGLAACFDNCPDDTNVDQLDADGDGLGDACDDCQAIEGIDNFDNENCACETGYYAATHEINGEMVIVNCSLCPAGQYCPDGITAIDCPPGSYSSETGQSECASCDAGSYNGNYGVTFCVPCAAGYFSGEPGATLCEPCAAGTFSSELGSTSCTACESGTYQPNDGSTECLDCCAGTDSQTGATSCDPDEIYSYTIISFDDVKMKENTVESGGVGVINSNKKVNLHQGTMITESSTFVRAPDLHLHGGSAVATYYEEQVDENILPDFQYAVHCDNDVDIPDNSAPVVLNLDCYDKIEVGENSSVIFSGHSTVSAKELKLKEGASVSFDQDTDLLLDKKLDAKESISISDDGYFVWIYVDGDVKFEEGSDITVNIYSQKKIKVEKADDDATFMNGLFIADKVDSKENVFWNKDPRDCSNEETPPNNAMVNPNGQMNEALQLMVYGSASEVDINWYNNTGFKNQRFEIERSNNGVDFTLLKEVPNQSDQASMRSYGSKDIQPEKGHNYYRIKLYLEDGSILYSNIEMARLQQDPMELSLYPNPALDEVFVNMKAFQGKPVEVTILNNLGQIMLQRLIDEVSEQKASFTVADFPAGLYTISIKAEGQRLISKSFVVTK